MSTYLVWCETPVLLKRLCGMLCRCFCEPHHFCAKFLTWSHYLNISYTHLHVSAWNCSSYFDSFCFWAVSWKLQFNFDTCRSCMRIVSCFQETRISLLSVTFPFQKTACYSTNEIRSTNTISLNIFSEYNQQDATFLKFIYFCKTLYMFQTGFPSIRAQNCTYSVRYLSDRYCYLLLVAASSR